MLWHLCWGLPGIAVGVTDGLRIVDNRLSQLIQGSLHSPATLEPSVDVCVYSSEQVTLTGNTCAQRRSLTSSPSTNLIGNLKNETSLAICRNAAVTSCHVSPAEAPIPNEEASITGDATLQ